MGPDRYNVVVVGAGAAGIGCAVLLHRLGVPKLLVLDRDRTGASFDRWPKGMRFITPSSSNEYRATDLNTVVPGTSVGVEHPTGEEYATYLRSLELRFVLPVRNQVEVRAVEPLGREFCLHTSGGDVYSRYVVWATGEYSYPKLTPFPGSEMCLHTSQVSQWKEISEAKMLVIGGAESGTDAAIELSSHGSQVTLIDSEAPWRADTDASSALSLYTRRRMADAATIRRVAGFRVQRIMHSSSGFQVISTTGPYLMSASPPILATGYSNGLILVKDLFEWMNDDTAILTNEGESTLVPGFFVVGPQRRHDGVNVAFIHEFRQRFQSVARAIASKLDVGTALLERDGTF